MPRALQSNRATPAHPFGLEWRWVHAPLGALARIIPSSVAKKSHRESRAIDRRRDRPALMRKDGGNPVAPLVITPRSAPRRWSMVIRSILVAIDITESAKH